MSDYVDVFSSQRISPADFISFVRHSSGGFITSEERVDGGVARDECYVWFYGVKEQLSRGCEDVAEGVVAKLGSRSVSHVGFELSSVEGSDLLALEIAYEFASRWPAVANCPLKRILDTKALRRLLVAQPSPERRLLGDVLSLVVEMEDMDLVPLIKRFGGTTEIDDERTLRERAQERRREVNILSMDEEDVFGLIVQGDAELWISSAHVLAAPDTTRERRIRAAIQERLSKMPRGCIWLGVGYARAHESEQLCYRFALEALEAHEGVVLGLFDEVLDATDLRRLIDANRGFLS